MVAAPFYNPTNNAQGFQFLHIVTDSCHFFFFLAAPLMGVQWCVDIRTFSGVAQVLWYFLEVVV